MKYLILASFLLFLGCSCRHNTVYSKPDIMKSDDGIIQIQNFKVKSTKERILKDSSGNIEVIHDN